jgi:hypothetical protein
MIAKDTKQITASFRNSALILLVFIIIVSFIALVIISTSQNIQEGKGALRREKQ